MKLKEGDLLREGDVVSLKVKVRFNVDPGDTTVFLSYAGYTFSTPITDLELVRRIFHIGDPVTFDNELDETPHRIGVVRAIFDDWIWVIGDDGAPATYLSTVLALYREPQETVKRIRPPPMPMPPPIAELVAESGESAAPLPELRSDGAEDDQGEVDF